MTSTFRTRHPQLDPPLLVLPFGLANGTNGDWSNPSLVATLARGLLCLSIFIFFEVFIAPKALMTKCIMKNRAFLTGLLLTRFNQTALSVGTT